MESSHSLGDSDAPGPTLLTPGPCQTSLSVRLASAAEDLNHRDPRFLALIQETKSRLLAVYPETKSWTPYLLGGSGTAAVEAMVTSLLPAGPCLVVANGYYSARIAEIFAIHGLPFELLEFDWLAPIDLDVIQDKLATHQFSSLVTTHHETTTGRLNPIGEIGELCAEYGVRLFADAMSSFGADPIPFSNLSALCASANKCLHGLPGVSFVLANAETAATARDRAPRTYYLHLPRYEGEVPPLTPPIPTLLSFRQALREMPADGAAGRGREYAEKLAILRHEFDSVVPIDQSSCTLITAKIPLGWSYEAWFNACYAAGFVIYGTKGPLRDQYFQVSVMGETSREDMTRFVLSARSILGTLPK